MKFFDKKKEIGDCKRDKDGIFVCRIRIGETEGAVRGTPPQIANEVAKLGICEIKGNIPEKLNGYLNLATDPNFQAELERFENIGRKRQIMNERAKHIPEEKEFMDRVKDVITGPMDERKIKEIGWERIAKFTSEEKRKKIK